MTREENIRAILETCFSGFKEELVDIAVDRIISLEQQPCEDVVSRQQAISSIRSLYPSIPFVKTELNLKKWQEENKKYFECENIIKALPPVTPTPKKGKWIGTRRIGFGEFVEYEVELIDGFVADNCHCSECGEELEKGERGIYCPYCGAEMESEE